MSDVLNVAGHPIDLDDGRTLAPGEEGFEVDTDHPHNESLVLNGHLAVTDEKPVQKKAQPKGLAVEADTSAQNGGDDK